jgi:hypothetical protein
MSLAGEPITSEDKAEREPLSMQGDVAKEAGPAADTPWDESMDETDVKSPSKSQFHQR